MAFADGSGFSYDAVAGASTDQESLFAAAGSPIVDAVLQGYNGCVIAYGQTGSGKTHTMLGSLSRDPRDGARGLAPRAFEALFERALAEAGGGASGGGATSSQRPPLRVSLSFVEIYNETITDLLAASGSSAHANEGGEHNNNNSSSSLHLREEKGRGVFVDGATVLHVADAAAAISLLAKGAAARRSAETRANAASSRSHAVCVALVERVAKVKTGSSAVPSSSSASAAAASATKTIARLTLVDLAGSERQAHTGAAGERLKEAAAINKSLSALGNVVAALAENSERTATATAAANAETGGREQPSAASAAAVAAAATAIKPLRHVPYRDSRLTFLLQDSLGGNSRTVLVATVSPDASCAGETMSTLRFAARARRVACRAVINPVVAPGGKGGAGGGSGGGDKRAEAALAAEEFTVEAALAIRESLDRRAPA